MTLQAVPAWPTFGNGIRPRQRGHSDSPAVSPTCRPGACTPPWSPIRRETTSICLRAWFSTTSPRSRVPITHSTAQPPLRRFGSWILLRQPSATARRRRRPGPRRAWIQPWPFALPPARCTCSAAVCKPATVLWAWTTCGSGTGPPGSRSKATCALLPARTRRWPTTRTASPSSCLVA